MPSRALVDWRSHRALRLDRLVAAHRTVRGANSGRRWITDELNHALILRLAAEFQGFARELHDDTTDAVVAALAPGDAGRQAILRIPYRAVRRLDRGNAGPEAVRADFKLFDLHVWSELGQHYPARPGGG